MLCAGSSVLILNSRGLQRVKPANTLENRMLLCAITNRHLLDGDEASRQNRLVETAAAWAAGGIHYIQLREKDLPLDALQPLASRVVESVRAAGSKTRILINGPAQVALDAGADGIHLPGGMGAAAIQAAQQVYARAGREAVISVACHSPEEIRLAAGASLLLFSPIFEKLTEERSLPGQGLAALRSAAQAASPVPVLALGGVNEKNAPACLEAGAAGIAAIRLFLGAGWRNFLRTSA